LSVRGFKIISPVAVVRSWQRIKRNRTGT